MLLLILILLLFFGPEAAVITPSAHKVVSASAALC
jgi:hypothetical protein